MELAQAENRYNGYFSVNKYQNKIFSSIWKQKTARQNVGKKVGGLEMKFVSPLYLRKLVIR